MPRLLSHCVLAAALVAMLAQQALAERPAVKPADVSLTQRKDLRAEDDFLKRAVGKHEVEQPKQEEPSLALTAMSFGAKLAFVLVLAYGTIYVLKRFSNGKGGFRINGPRVRVLESVNLAANRSLHLVEAGTRSFLVSSTPGQVNLIAELAEGDLPKPESESQQNGFGEQLSSFMTHDSASPMMRVAGLLRESSSFLQDKVREAARVRGGMRNG